MKTSYVSNLFYVFDLVMIERVRLGSLPLAYLIYYRLSIQGLLNKFFAG
jgi:hypothetical protein